MEGKANYIIIGISGTTNSGKTTLVEKLRTKFDQVQVINQDTYFMEPDDERLKPFYVPEVDHANWEQLGVLEMDTMMQDVDEWKAECSQKSSETVPILIVEGFLVLNHRELSKYFNKKYFLSIDKETCIERRRHRSYNPPDKPGYFEKVVWPMYLTNRQEMEVQKDIVYLDGREDQDRMVTQIAADIQELVQSRLHGQHTN